MPCEDLCLVCISSTDLNMCQLGNVAVSQQGSLSPEAKNDGLSEHTRLDEQIPKILYFTETW